MAAAVVLNLYSTSPRRQELLERLGISFKSVPVDADESVPDGLSPEQVVVVIARRKLEAGLAANPDTGKFWGLGADTLVEGPAGLLGKPGNKDDAAAMLRSLSGVWHSVYTGIAVFSPDKTGSAATRDLVHSTTVKFRKLTDDEISAYILTDEWQGVAGAYRIQGRGALLIEAINGLWSTVVGLPLSPLYGILSAMSYPFG